jgi:cytochrome c-type biogenesis protein CcmH
VVSILIGSFLVLKVRTRKNTANNKKINGANEIRCPVCQGQSIGGSNAGLAKDLRKKVKDLILKQKKVI